MNLKARFASGKPILGTFVKTPHPHVVEVLAASSLDCLVLDAEHAPFDRGNIDLCIMAARAGGMPVLVRPASYAPEHILNALDCGADGVLIPHVRSAKDARRISRSASYGAGGRGYSGSSRAAGYGSSSIQDHLDLSASKTMLIIQIEDLEALDELDEIAGIEGVDALFIGVIDLTVALGRASPDDPMVMAAVDFIINCAVRAQLPVGIFVSQPDDVALWRRKGVRFFLLGSDHSLLRNGAAQIRRDASL